MVLTRAGDDSARPVITSHYQISLLVTGQADLRLYQIWCHLSLPTDRYLSVRYRINFSLIGLDRYHQTGIRRTKRERSDIIYFLSEQGCAYLEGFSCLVFWLRFEAKHERKVNSELLLKSVETGFLDDVGEVLHSVSGDDEVHLLWAVDVDAKTLGFNLSELVLKIRY